MSEPHLAAETLASSEKQKDFDIPEQDHYSKKDVESESTLGRDVTGVLQNERDIVTHVISVQDDPSLSPWTFRAFFIGLGLSTFGGILGKR